MNTLFLIWCVFLLLSGDSQTFKVITSLQLGILNKYLNDVLYALNYHTS